MQKVRVLQSIVIVVFCFCCLSTNLAAPVLAMPAPNQNELLIFKMMIITTSGNVIRQAISKIRETGRATQGIRLIRLTADDQIGDVARIVKEGNE